MPVQITVTVTGLDEIQRRFAGSPELVKAAQLDFLRKSRRLVLRNVRANIPVRTQRLTPPQNATITDVITQRIRKGKVVNSKPRRVVRVGKNKWLPPGTTRRSVRASLSTAQMKTTIFSKWYISRFLETGTVRMSAQQPFQRAAEASQGAIQGFVGEMAQDIAAKLEGRA